MRVFRLAAAHGLRLDFHVDEGLRPEANAFDDIVRMTAEYGMAGRVLCGHACALSIRPDADVARVMDAAGRAGVALTVMPTTNLHLQDMVPGRTPRLRGLAPMQELRAAGDWLDAITTAPARAMGLASPEIAVGAPADFITIAGADWAEALASSRAIRQLYGGGVEISQKAGE